MRSTQTMPMQMANSYDNQYVNLHDKTTFNYVSSVQKRQFVDNNQKTMALTEQIDLENKRANSWMDNYGHKLGKPCGPIHDDLVNYRSSRSVSVPAHNWSPKQQAPFGKMRLNVDAGRCAHGTPETQRMHLAQWTPNMHGILEKCPGSTFKPIYAKSTIPPVFNEPLTWRRYGDKIRCKGAVKIPKTARERMNAIRSQTARSVPGRPGPVTDHRNIPSQFYLTDDFPGRWGWQLGGQPVGVSSKCKIGAY
eukprot:gene1202-726_t